MRLPRRPNKDKIKRPGDVVRGVAAQLPHDFPVPEDSFSDGVAAENRRIMDPAYGATYELGPHVEPQQHDSVHGPATLVTFPKFWRDWMAKQTPKRLSVMDEIMDERIERETIQKWFRGMRQGALFALVGCFAGARWFSEQISWIMEKLPVLKSLWYLITGAFK